MKIEKSGHQKNVGSATLSGMPILEKKLFFPLISQQQGIFYDQLRNVDSRLYNNPIAVKINGTIDVERLRNSLQLIVNARDALRVQFSFEAGQVCQSILESIEVKLEKFTVSGSIDEAVERFCVPFDLDQAPLWRFGVVECEGGLHLVFDFHHIICDGVTKALFIKDLDDLYSGRAEIKPEIGLNECINISLRKSKEDFEKNKEFWKNTLHLMQSKSVIKTDFERTTSRRGEGAYVCFTVEAPLISRLTTAALELGATLFQMVFSSYAIWLRQQSDCNDFVIGTPMRGRGDAALASEYGMYANTVCVRVKPFSELTVSDFIKQTSQTIYQATKHQNYPFSALVDDFNARGDGTRNPIFDAMLSYYSDGFHNVPFLDSPSRWKYTATGCSVFDFNVLLKKEEGVLLGEWIFDKSLFERATIENYIAEFLSVLEVVSKSSAGSLVLGELF